MTSGHVQSVWVRRDGNSSPTTESLSKVSFVPVIAWRLSLSPTNLYEDFKYTGENFSIKVEKGKWV